MRAVRFLRATVAGLIVLVGGLIAAPCLAALRFSGRSTPARASSIVSPQVMPGWSTAVTTVVAALAAVAVFAVMTRPRPAPASDAVDSGRRGSDGH
jgi:hypothetical protein